MKSQLDTPNRVAFERYTEAVSCIESYRISGKRDLVEKSESLLEKARTADPEWVKPAYLQSILKDLSGDPDTAIRELERFREIPDSSFALEVEYNLGAAHYHRYGKQHLEEAETLFRDVKLKAAKTLQPLSLLASSSLAQVYGMRVQLKEPENFVQIKPTAKKWYERAIAEANDALDGLKKWKRSKSFRVDRGATWIADEIEWGATNAVGFAGSFWSDYLPPQARVPLLQKSILLFQTGLKLRPNHWATLCNLASAKMRLGYALRVMGTKKEGERLLNDALNHLDLVLTPDIRPDYAFALYERGRVLRLLGRFGEAIDSLSKVAQLPREKRDVSPKTFGTEIDLANESETYFLRKYD